MISEKIIFEIISDNLDEKVDLHRDMLFESIRIDSIVFIKIIVNLEDKLNIEFDDEMLIMSKFNKVGDLVDYIKEKVGKSPL